MIPTVRPEPFEVKNTSSAFSATLFVTKRHRAHVINRVMLPG